MKTLEESANEYALQRSFESYNVDAMEVFKAGANWQASQGWVSVKEKLPDENFKSYLCTSGNNYVPYIATWHSAMGKFDYDGEYFLPKYWREIPQPPK